MPILGRRVSFWAGLLFLIAVRGEQRVSQYRAVLMVVPFGRDSSRMAPLVSPKTIHMTFLAKMLVLNFVGNGSFLAFQTIDFFLVGGVKWWTLVSSPMMMPDNNSSPFVCIPCQKVNGSSYSLLLMLLHQLVQYPPCINFSKYELHFITHQNLELPHAIHQREVCIYLLHCPMCMWYAVCLHLANPACLCNIP